jgi:hypothetical protein
MVRVKVRVRVRVRVMLGKKPGLMSDDFFSNNEMAHFRGRLLSSDQPSQIHTHGRNPAAVRTDTADRRE